MKKIIGRITSSLLLIIFLLGLCTVVYALPKPTITASEETTLAGEDVNVSIVISNNPGLVNLLMSVEYDISVLTLTNVTDGGIICKPNNAPTYTANPYKLAWEDDTSPTDYTGNGLLTTLTFHVSNSAAPGTYPITLSINDGDAYNVDIDDVSFSLVNGSITVEEKVVNVTGVTIDSTLSVDIAEKKTPSFNVLPADATNKAVSFSTGDSSIATVNETTGEVTGVKKGTTVITVTTTDGGFSDTCSVTVSCSHKNKTSILEKESTCKNAGWDAYSECNACHQLFDASNAEISAIPYRPLSTVHTYTNYVSNNDATCTADGTKTAKCDTCGVAEDTKTDTGSKKAHVFTSYVSNNNATCTSNCTETAKCDTCGVAEDTRDIPGTKLAHTYTNYVSNNDATCTADGTKTAVCDVCGAAPDTITDTGSKKAHVFTNYVSNNDATCTKDGTKTAKCDTCGVAEDTKTDPGTKLAHNFAEQVSPEFIKTPATCTSKAVYYKSCTSCGLTNDETFEAGALAAHNFVFKSDKDAHWKECTVCHSTDGESEKHTFKYVKTKEPTTKEEGLEEEICEVCGYKSGNTKPIEKLVEKSIAPASDSVIYDVPKTVEFALGKFESGTIVTGTEVETGTIFETAKKALDGVATKLVVFDFVATKDGVRVQPNGKVQVTIDIPADLSADNLAMFYVSDDGAKKKLSIKVDKVNRKVTTELDHFSTYVLANVTKSPKGNDSDVAVLIIALLAVMGTSVLVGVKRRRGNNK